MGLWLSVLRLRKMVMVWVQALRNIWQHVLRKPPEERDDSSKLKKRRVVWSLELHQQFVAAVNQLGIDKAVPKKILELMNVPGLTRANVASHLQKYRVYLRRLSGQLGQLPPQSLATLQVVALGRSNNSKSAISVPVIDQRNIFSFENPKSRYSDVQSQHLNNNSNSNSNSKQINLLPTNMEPKQFASLHQSGQHSFVGSMNNQVVIQMGGQTQSQHQVQLNANAHHGLRQPVLSNDMLTRDGAVDMASTVYSEQYGQDDLLAAMLKQQQQRGCRTAGKRVWIRRVPVG